MVWIHSLASFDRRHPSPSYPAHARSWVGLDGLDMKPNEAIKYLLAGRPPEIVNGGGCYQFAVDLATILPNAVAMVEWKQAHAFVKYRGRFYDSETPVGVKNHKDLGCYRRLRVRAGERVVRL